MELTVAITGASGAPYAYRTLLHLAASGSVERINLIMSEAAVTVARVELGVDLRDADQRRINEWLALPADSKLVRLHRLDNLAATPASGSHPQAGMIVVPCSMGTLGAIATGAGTNLIHRAADVTLKEDADSSLSRANLHTTRFTLRTCCASPTPERASSPPAPPSIIARRRSTT